jgi:acetyl-CoA carboxylase carboxyl transferase subunit alpha
MPKPEGYRKALRIMKLAEKFHLPIITLIDTPGAYPGIGAEERGQSQAIADNLLNMSLLKVPIISLVIGEGASGGALAIGLSDRILCLENSWYSVISPEGCASILFGDTSKNKEAAESLKLTSEDLYELNIADIIIDEPVGGIHHNPSEVYIKVVDILCKEINYLTKLSVKDLINQRMNKYDNIGKFLNE